ncbi:MAG: GntR family transcriptional regulator [Christensenellaceae bacterium]
MNFTANGEPLFEQIASRIRQLIEAGVYAPDEKLPSVREFALSMGVNPKTVVRAYEALEREGALYSLQKKGYFVSPVSADAERKSRIAAFKKAIEPYRGKLTKAEMLAAIEELEVES